MLKIDHKGIPELCSRLGQPQPFNVLTEMIRRNSTMKQVKPAWDSRPLGHQHHEYELTVGSRTVKVRGGNKRDAKQQASQLMLKVGERRALQALPFGKLVLVGTVSERRDLGRRYAPLRRRYAGSSARSATLQAQTHKPTYEEYSLYTTTFLYGDISAADEISDSFAVSNEAIGSELRTALKAMEDRFNTNRHRDAVLRPPIGYTAPPLPTDDCAHFSKLCKRYAHLFSDANLLNSMIE